MSEWERAHARVGRGGNQSELHRQLVALFGDMAPSRSAVSKWLRGAVPPEPIYGEMLAQVLGVRAAWLYFNDGPMVAEVDHLEAFHQEQERKYPPREKPQTSPKKGRRAG